MSEMIRIRNGHFGRVAILHLDHSLVEHAHSAGHLLFWLDGDMNLMEVGGERIPFDSNHCVAINSWEPHSVPVKQKNQQCLFLLFYLDTIWLTKHCMQLGVAPVFNTASINVTAHMRALVQYITTLLLSEQDDDIDIETHVIELLESTLHTMQTDSITPSISDKGKIHTDFRIRKSVTYMQNHLDTRSSFEDVAREAGISRPHFFSLFRKHMKMTPSVFWNTLRMENAINLLVSTDISLSELAYNLGFSEPANFSRFFRNHSGVAPSQYRLVGGRYMSFDKNENGLISH
jgi:AraC family transcriptional regulator